MPFPSKATVTTIKHYPTTHLRIFLSSPVTFGTHKRAPNSNSLPGPFIRET